MARARILVAVGATFTALAAALSACGGDDTANPVPPPDAATPVDGSNDTTLPDVADGAACTPRDLTGFTPTWTPPAGFHQKKCSKAQNATIAACLQVNADRAACTAFFGASENAECLRCASAPENHFGGCVALATGDLSPSGCGAKFDALIECSNYACAGCPLPTPFALDAGNSEGAGICAAGAQNGACKPYADAARCTSGLLSDGGPAAVCNHPGDVAYFAELFCGDVPSDAGLDAPSDG
jgi:hypothetical protein